MTTLHQRTNTSNARTEADVASHFVLFFGNSDLRYCSARPGDTFFFFCLPISFRAEFFSWCFFFLFFFLLMLSVYSVTLHFCQCCRSSDPDLLAIRPDCVNDRDREFSRRYPNLYLGMTRYIPGVSNMHRNMSTPFPPPLTQGMKSVSPLVWTPSCQQT